MLGLGSCWILSNMANLAAMTKPGPAIVNKQGGGYSARPVFHSGAGGLLGNFAARAAADRRGGSGWADWSAAAEGAGDLAAAPAPATQNQWFRRCGDGQVSQSAPQVHAEMADFCGFAGRRRLIISYQTGGREGDRGASIWAKIGPGGGLSPFAPRPNWYPGRARQTCAWPKRLSLRLGSGRPIQRLEKGAIIWPLPMGSGVRGALNRKVYGGKSAAMRQARRLDLGAGIRCDRRGLGLSPMIESERR